jgi:NhaA family Na+:H+ antiporter
LLLVAGRQDVTHYAFFLIFGAALWYAVHQSGIHATISGVVLGLAVPGRLRHRPREVLRELTEHTSRLMQGAEDEGVDAVEIQMIEDRLVELTSPLARFVRRMHPLVAFFIMPAFALANSGIPLQGVTRADLMSSVTLGTALGLLLGKLIGIFVFTVAVVRIGIAPMPGGATGPKLFGTAVVGGIGFTVALFIAALAFPDDPHLLMEAKLGIILGSLASGVIGAAILVATPELAPSEPRIKAAVPSPSPAAPTRP